MAVSPESGCPLQMLDLLTRFDPAYTEDVNINEKDGRVMRLMWGFVGEFILIVDCPLMLISPPESDGLLSGLKF